MAVRLDSSQTNGSTCQYERRFSFMLEKNIRNDAYRFVRFLKASKSSWVYSSKRVYLVSGRSLRN
jgi:hypothetical protein